MSKVCKSCGCLNVDNNAKFCNGCGERFDAPNSNIKPENQTEEHKVEPKSEPMPESKPESKPEPKPEKLMRVTEVEEDDDDEEVVTEVKKEPTQKKEAAKPISSSVLEEDDDDDDIIINPNIENVKAEFPPEEEDDEEEPVTETKPSSPAVLIPDEDEVVPLKKKPVTQPSADVLDDNEEPILNIPQSSNFQPVEEEEDDDTEIISNGTGYQKKDNANVSLESVTNDPYYNDILPEVENEIALIPKDIIQKVILALLIAIGVAIYLVLV